VAQDASQEVFKNIAVQGNLSVRDISVKMESPAIGAAPIKASLKSDYRFPPRIEGAWVVRESLQMQLEKWVTERVSLCGLWALSGFGKSWLAAWAFQEFGSQFGVAQWIRFVGNDLISFQQFGRFVLQELGRSVDEKLSNAELRGALVAELARQDCLLVLDQVEAIESGAEWAEFAEFWREWAEYGQRSMVMVTTRRQFERSGMQWLPVPGLNEREGRVFLAQYEGIRSGDGIGDLVVAASGHPYLLRFAGSWLVQAKGKPTTVGAEDVRLFRSLFGNQMLDLTQKVEVVFGRLFAELLPFLQEMLLKVTVYRGDLGLTAAQGMVAEVTIDDLRQLQEKGFLVAVQDDRFILHPLVEGFIRSRVAEEQRREAHEGAIAYYSANFQKWDGTIESCREELESFYHACELGQYQRAIELLERCYKLLDRAGQWRSLLPLYAQLTIEWQAANDTEAKNLGWAWTRLGNLYDQFGDYRSAIDAHDQAQAIFDRIDFPQGQAASLGNLGNAYNGLGQYQRAIDFHQQSLEIDREIGDRGGEANSLGSLGNAYQSLGQYQRAIDFHQQSLEIAREIGDRGGEANSLGSLGVAYGLLGQYQQSIDFNLQSLEIAREIGDYWGEGTSLLNMGLALESLNRRTEALDHFQQAKVIFTKLQLDHMIEQCDSNIQRCQKAIDKSQRNQRLRSFFLCFGIGLAIVFLIYWLKQ
jgi:tetratricopeptide (TPR) repeat protein